MGKSQNKSKRFISIYKFKIGGLLIKLVILGITNQII